MIPRQPKSNPFMVPTPAERYLEDEREAKSLLRPSRTQPKGRFTLMRHGGSQK